VYSLHMRLFTAARKLAGLLFVSAVFAAQSLAQQPPITYISDDRARAGLFAVNADGAGRVMIHSGKIIGADVSGDGQLTVFVSPNEDGKSIIYSYSRATGMKSFVGTVSRGFGSLKISPDKSKIVLSDSGVINVINLATSAESRVFDDGTRPDWIDDNTIIFLEKVSKGGGEFISTIRPNGTGRARRVGPGLITSYDLSPTRANLLYVNALNIPVAIWTPTAWNGARNIVTSNMVSEPKWLRETPSNQRAIAVSKIRILPDGSASFALFRIATSNGVHTPLPTLMRYAYPFAVSPDGSKVLFAGPTTNGNLAIGYMNTNGQGQPFILETIGLNVRPVAWR
jgi:WD40 repeat protein